MKKFIMSVKEEEKEFIRKRINEMSFEELGKFCQLVEIFSDNLLDSDICIESIIGTISKMDEEDIDYLYEIVSDKKKLNQEYEDYCNSDEQTEEYIIKTPYFSNIFVDYERWGYAGEIEYSCHVGDELFRVDFSKYEIGNIDAIIPCDEKGNFDGLRDGFESGTVKIVLDKKRFAKFRKGSAIC